MRIRKYSSDDAKEVSALVGKNLLEVNTKDYTRELMSWLADCYSPDSMNSAAIEKEVFVGVEGGKVVATAALLDGGWIHDVFVDPQWHGKGIGRAMMAFLERLAKSRNVRAITVPSSITAVSFYENIWYQPLKQTVSEEGLTEVLMEKEL